MTSNLSGFEDYIIIVIYSLMSGVTYPHWNLSSRLWSQDWGRNHSSRRRSPGPGMTPDISTRHLSWSLFRTVSWSRWRQRTGRTAGDSSSRIFPLTRISLQMLQRAWVRADLWHCRHPGLESCNDKRRTNWCIDSCNISYNWVLMKEKWAPFILNCPSILGLLKRITQWGSRL